MGVNIIKDGSYNVCFIGAGYVGGTTSAILALKNPSVRFTVVDNDHERIKSWNSDKIPIREPAFFEIILEVSEWHVASNRSKEVPPSLRIEEDKQKEQEDPSPQYDYNNGGTDSRNEKILAPNLNFSTDVRGAIAMADVIFITVNTPSKISPMEHEWDLSHFDSVMDMIVDVATSRKIIVEKSTVPCGNAQRVAKMLESKARPGASFTVLSNPEFLSAGSAVQDLPDPYSVIIGSPSLHPRSDLDTSFLLSLYDSWIPEEKIRLMSTSSSELVKIANNAFQAQRISSINSLSAICELIGANILDLSQSLGMNPNIGPHYLRAGVGFGGSCLRKDTLGLSGIATNLFLPEVAAYWRQVVTINDFRIMRFTGKTCQHGSMSSSRFVAILGFAFKKDTNDPRNSIAKDVILALLIEGATVAVNDPLVSVEAIKSSFSPTDRVRVCHTPYEACIGAETIAILNDSVEYAQLNWERISANMGGEKKVVIDGRNFVNDAKLEAFDLIVEKLVKPI